MKMISDVLKETYGEKVYKLSLESGCTCPTRDGSIGTGGCSFCSVLGSGEFAAPRTDSGKDLSVMLDEQIRDAKSRIAAKTDAEKFIAYFQSFSNTYGDEGFLEELYTCAVKRDDIAVLSLGTRPDCINGSILSMLKRLNSIKPVWVELGLQTVHQKTADMFGRGYGLDVFEQAYADLMEAGITVIVHVILGLPGESREDMLDTVRYLSGLKPVLDGIKIHMLQILKGTSMGDEYLKKPFNMMTLEEYAYLVKDCIDILPEETVIHRITGDGPKSLLIAPEWCKDKKRVLNTMRRIIGY
ncbi:MAG: TIGR01212 family radical SAM protein [Christensenellaceae bacterium]|nr:TIGR01212 family radical SAM protein [Christensenellaceae bacterium]